MNYLGRGTRSEKMLSSFQTHSPEENKGSDSSGKESNKEEK